MLWVHPHGKGRIFVYAAPLEMGVTVTRRAFEGEAAAPYWHICKAFAPERLTVRIEDPFIGVTEHEMTDGSFVVVATNHTNAGRNLNVAMKDRFVVKDVWAAKIMDGMIALGPFQSAILLLRR